MCGGANRYIETRPSFVISGTRESEGWLAAAPSLFFVSLSFTSSTRVRVLRGSQYIYQHNYGRPTYLSLIHI